MGGALDMGPPRQTKVLTARGGGTFAEPAGGQSTMGTEGGTMLATLGKSRANLGKTDVWTGQDL